MRAEDLKQTAGCMAGSRPPAGRRIPCGGGYGGLQPNPLGTYPFTPLPTCRRT